MVEKPHWLNTEDADIFDGQVLCNLIGSFGCTILWTYQIGIFLTPGISHRMATLLACGWMLVYWWPMFFVFFRKRLRRRVAAWTLSNWYLLVVSVAWIIISYRVNMLDFPIAVISITITFIVACIAGFETLGRLRVQQENELTY
jgi:hypothetical protein